MLEKLNFIESKYEELSIKISDPAVMANQKEWQKLCKEHADLEDVVVKYREYKKVQEDIEADKGMLREDLDKELKEMVQEEIKDLNEREETLLQICRKTWLESRTNKFKRNRYWWI